MSTFQTTGARATGLATIAADGTVLDTWFPAPELAADVAASGSTRLTQAEAVAALGADVAQALVACSVRSATVVARISMMSRWSNRETMGLYLS